MNTLVRYGFDSHRLAFAGRTAIGACLAVFIAWHLGLEHPQWAGMTVWASSQANRNQLFEKGLFRFAGTVTGSVIGVLLVLASAFHPALLIAGLALWVGACTAISSLQRGFVSYGTVLAGYTAAMVALLDTAHPDHVFALGADRLATVLTGVLVALGIGALFAPPTRADALRAQVRSLIADVLTSDAERAALMSRIAALEEGLEPHGAGSLRLRREVRATRALLIAALSVLLRAPGSRTAAASALRDDDVAQAAALLIDDPETADLGRALRAWSDIDLSEIPPVVLHRDWVGAREAGLRATATIAVFGGFWLLTGIHSGPFMLLGLSIMVSIFAGFENPARQMRFVFIGQSYGVLGALICRWLVWPHAGSELEMILMMFPFILFGPLLVGHQRTFTTSFDYNMVFLLMLQPHLPLGGTFVRSVETGLAVVAAPLCAMVIYRTIYPPTHRRRIVTLLGMMMNDLRALAADPGAVAHREVWRARLYHRTLRLVRLTERSPKAEIAALPACVALLTLGQAALAAHMVGGRAAETALARLASRPEKAARALRHLAQQTGDPVFARAAACVPDLPRITP